MSLTTLCVRIIKSYEVLQSNLPTEHKRMHKFTEVANEEKKKFHVTHHMHYLSEW